MSDTDTFATDGLDEAWAGVSPRGRQILELLRQSAVNPGYPPSVREIGRHLGLRSPASVHRHLKDLEEAGYIRRDSTKPRAIVVVGLSPPTPIPSGQTQTVPRLGRIAAGVPILAEENVEEVMALPEALVGKTGPLFMLEVKGDSMVEAGILDGDLVVVRKQPDLENGEIGAFRVEGEEATVKRLERRRSEVILHATNPDYPPLVYRSGIDVLGKVVAVLRSLAGSASGFRFG
ncbi:MAG: transcriptional repressor LexA [Acidimicrobiia bacterium]|nr:transcriptional repressor LexA [Acidimicrobiia bacterium]